MDQKLFLEEVLIVISQNFGEANRKLYAEFYRDKKPEVILSSCQELLVEYLGPEQAAVKITPLKIRIGKDAQ